MPCPRPPRLALCVIPGLDHFTPDLVRALENSGRMQARVFRIDTDGLAAALAWTDAPSDAVWFEFCWPPFPALFAGTDFGHRRVVVRIHRIEAYGADHVARADWTRVDDVIVVCQDMRRRVLAAAPELGFPDRVRVIGNGVDIARFPPLTQFDPFRIGWCGWITLHKNPVLALEILHRLRREDPRYHLAVTTKGGEPVAYDSFKHLVARLQLSEAVILDGAVPADRMGQWHASNGVLLSTSVYESFGYAIAEAACCGCDVAMLDHAAAAEFWPEEMRFACIDDAVAKIRAARPHRWRDLVTSNYSLDRQASHLLETLLTPAEHYSVAK